MAATPRRAAAAAAAASLLFLAACPAVVGELRGARPEAADPAFAAAAGGGNGGAPPPRSASDETPYLALHPRWHQPAAVGAEPRRLVERLPSDWPRKWPQDWYMNGSICAIIGIFAIGSAMILGCAAHIYCGLRSRGRCKCCSRSKSSAVKPITGEEAPAEQDQAKAKVPEPPPVRAEEQPQEAPDKGPPNQPSSSSRQVGDPHLQPGPEPGEEEPPLKESPVEPQTGCGQDEEAAGQEAVAPKSAPTSGEGPGPEAAPEEAPPPAPTSGEEADAEAAPEGEDPGAKATRPTEVEDDPDIDAMCQDAGYSNSLRGCAAKVEDPPQAMAAVDTGEASDELSEMDADASSAPGDSEPIASPGVSSPSTPKRPQAPTASESPKRAPESVPPTVVVEEKEIEEEWC